jgi:hypothetical protein
MSIIVCLGGELFLVGLAGVRLGGLEVNVEGW